jgi:hypothetical protein
MAQDPVTKFSGRAPLVFPDVGVVIYAPPKAACSSIKQTMAETYKDKKRRRIEGSDGIVRGARRQALHDLKRYKFDPSYMRIGFCRNPYSKVISIYRNKLIKAKTVKPKLTELGFYRKIPFNRFINLVASIPDDRAEKHLLSQWLFLFKHGPPDVLIKFEKLEEGWERVKDIFAERGRKGVLDLMRLNTSDGVRKPVLTPKMKKQIFERYKKDFELLGYKK